MSTSNIELKLLSLSTTSKAVLTELQAFSDIISRPLTPKASAGHSIYGREYAKWLERRDDMDCKTAGDSIHIISRISDGNLVFATSRLVAIDDNMRYNGVQIFIEADTGECGGFKLDWYNSSKERIGQTEYFYGGFSRHPVPPKAAHFSAVFRINAIGEAAVDCLHINNAVAYSQAEAKGSPEVETYLPELEARCARGYGRILREKLQNMPRSNGSRYFSKLPLAIGLVSGVVTYRLFKDAANITRLGSLTSSKRFDLPTIRGDMDLSDEKFDLLMICGDTDLSPEECLEHIRLANAKDTQTVFYDMYGKYEQNLRIAKECDFIFCLSEFLMDKYRADCGHDRVYILPHGVNPLIHNPIGCMDKGRETGVLYRGMCDRAAAETHDDMVMLFEGCLGAGLPLHILDTQFADKSNRYHFQPRFIPYITPDMGEPSECAGKLYDYSIAINLSKYTRAIWERSIYEYQACGSMVFSNYNIAVNEEFPNIRMFVSKDDIGAQVRCLTPAELAEIRMAGVRAVMSGNTAYDRLARILDIVGISIPYRGRVLVAANKVTDTVRRMFGWQSYHDIVLIPESELTVAVAAEYDMVCFWDADRLYDNYYIEDMVNAFKYTNSVYVTHDAYYNGGSFHPGTEHGYVSFMPDKYRTMFWRSAADNLADIPVSCELEGGYSVDACEYNARYITASPAKEIEYALTVVTPIYNTGGALMHKCLGSLRRCSIFDKMEIILLDDCSDDGGKTVQAIERISRRYGNVITYFYKNSNGGPSRARNKGIYMASAPYIVCLDSDDEMINDGYTVLLEKAIETGADLSFGERVKLFENYTEWTNAYEYMLKAGLSNGVFSGDVTDFYIKTDFVTINLAAFIMKSSMVRENNIRMLEGAYGEDTLFYLHAMSHAKRIYAMPEPVYTHYAARSGSAINAVGVEFFRKYALFEKHRFHWILKSGELDARQQRPNGNTPPSFYWHMPKLKYVAPSEQRESIDILYSIYEPYERCYPFNVGKPAMFMKLYRAGDYDEILKQWM